MKLFTIDEANALLPHISAQLKRIRYLYERSAAYRSAVQAAASAAEFGGGMKGGARYVKTLYEIGKLTTGMHRLGVQIKDYSRGLVDFPSYRDDRIVLLCWQLGEPERIEWWHEIETGFAGRRPL